MTVVEDTPEESNTSESKLPYGVFGEEYPRRVIGRALRPEHMWGKWTLVRRFLVIPLFVLDGTANWSGESLYLATCKVS